MAKKKDSLIIEIKTDGAGKTTASIAGISKGMGKLDGNVKGASKSLLSLKNILGTVAFAAAAKGIFDANVEYQKLKASLKTVTGSMEKANEEWAKLEKFTQDTPFQLNQVVDSFIKLKALGLNPSMKALTSYGNTASAMGKDLNQMIEAVADASTGEFERLKEFGIKARQQGDDVSFTFQGITTTVKKNAGDIEEYLQSIGEKQFAGAMKEQMDTLGGAVSNLEDAFGGLARQIGDSGFNDAMKSLIQDFTSLVNAISGAPRSLAEIQKELDSLENRRFGRSAKSNNAGARAKLQDELSAAKIALGGIQGITEEVTVAEDAIAAAVERIRELKQKINETPESEQVTTQGSGRSKRLTLFGRAKKELDDLEAALPELQQKAADLFNTMYVGALDDESTDAPTGAAATGNAESRPNIFTGLTPEEMDADYQNAVDMGAQMADEFHAQAQARADAEVQANAIIMNARMNTARQGVALLQAFAGKSKAAAIAAIALSKGLAMAEANNANLVAAEAARASATIAAPPGAGLAAGAAAYASVRTQGAITLGLIAATGLVQASNVGGGAGGGAALGAPANPVTTTNDFNSGAPQDLSGDGGTVGTINIVVNGVMTQEIVDDVLVPAIRDGIDNRDVILINGSSRQAQELVSL